MLLIILGTIGTVVVLAGSVVFLFGEDLFGSDPGTIDSYNEEILESCDVPPDSTLVRTYVLRVYDRAGQSYRSLSYVYASPADSDEIISFYGLVEPNQERLVSNERACRFSQRPAAIVVGLSDSNAENVLDSITETGSTNVADVADPPSVTRSFVRLRLAQREAEGIF